MPVAVDWDSIKEQVHHQFVSTGLDVNEAIAAKAAITADKPEITSFYGQAFSPKLIALTAAWRADRIATPQGLCRRIADQVVIQSRSNGRSSWYLADLSAIISRIPFAGFTGLAGFRVEMGKKGSPLSKRLVLDMRLQAGHWMVIGVKLPVGA